MRVAESCGFGITFHLFVWSVNPKLIRVRLTSPNKLWIDAQRTPNVRKSWCKQTRRAPCRAITEKIVRRSDCMQNSLNHNINGIWKFIYRRINVSVWVPGKCERSLLDSVLFCCPNNCALWILWVTRWQQHRSFRGPSGIPAKWRSRDAVGVRDASERLFIFICFSCGWQIFVRTRAETGGAANPFGRIENILYEQSFGAPKRHSVNGVVAAH